MSAACERFETPVTGNVSFYNQTQISDKVDQYSQRLQSE